MTINKLDVENLEGFINDLTSREGGVVMFSTGCPQCKVLENALNRNRIEHVTIKDVDAMLRLGIMTAPMLKVWNYDGKVYPIMGFSEAMEWIGDFDYDTADCEPCRECGQCK